MNGGVDVTLAASVKEVQEHDDSQIKSDPNAIAPFSKGRAGLLGTTLRLESGWSANRALYNVVRASDLGNVLVKAAFGEDGALCSTDARPLIEAAGFQQLATPDHGGVCGQPTQSATSNFTINEQVATTTTLEASSPKAKSAKLVATVTGSTSPSGSVDFFEGATQVANDVPLVSGAATYTATGVSVGEHTYRAVFTPAEGSAFEPSEGEDTVSVKTSATIAETFPASVAAGAKAKGTVTVSAAGATHRQGVDHAGREGPQDRLAQGRQGDVHAQAREGQEQAQGGVRRQRQRRRCLEVVHDQAEVRPAVPVRPLPRGRPRHHPSKERTMTTTADETTVLPAMTPPAELAEIEAREITAWFGDRKVLDRVSLTMPAGGITALIGPSGCGKSTFLRILNRMHELVPSAQLAGEVLLDGEDIYDPAKRLIDARRAIGMVFQKPNPFPAMSIRENVLAGLKLTGTKASRSAKDELVESCLRKGGLWEEVKDRLDAPGGGLSGGQQQRLCIARSLAIKPRVLLMDEPCSALDPTSTRVIEETMRELAHEVTIVIVTHNMQQAARVSDTCAFFLASQGTPGVIVEHGDTGAMFQNPQDPRTSDYVHGRFG